MKAVDSSIKKESDLPAADPSTPIPLKYEESGARAVEKEIALLLDRGQQHSLTVFTRMLYISPTASCFLSLFHCELLLLSLFLCFYPAAPCGEWLKLPMRSGMLPGSWQHQMKLQLFLKASKAYYVLAEAATNLQKYGRALRYIKLSLQCHGERTRIEKNTLRSAHCNVIILTCLLEEHSFPSSPCV